MSAQKYDLEKIEKMREAGDICYEIVSILKSEIKVGAVVTDIDKFAEELCKASNVKPAFKGFEGFPSSICANINNIVVHGIPDDYKLENGDIFGLDFGIEHKGVFVDTSQTFTVGTVTEEVKKLLNVTREATLAGISQAIPGNKVGDIGATMQKIVENAGFSVVRELVGHGIGYELHEDPYVPGYGVPNTGETLYKGQTIAIEAMVNQGTPEVYISPEDGWTIYTKDGMLSALFEHTVVVDEKPEILTKW